MRRKLRREEESAKIKAIMRSASAVYAFYFIIRFIFLLPFFSPHLYAQKAKEGASRFPGLTFPLREVARLTTEGKPGNNLVASGGRLFSLSENGFITCYDLEAGKKLWSYDLSRRARSQLAVGSSSLFVIDEENSVVALTADGALLWKKSFHQPFAGQLILWKDKLIAATTESQVLALSIASGDLLWSASLDSAVLTPFFLAEKLLLTVSSKGTVYSLGADDRVQAVGSAARNLLPYASFSGSDLIFGTEDKQVLRWSIERRRQLWAIKLAGRLVASPLVTREGVFVVTSNAVLYCLNFRSGEVKWWRSLPSRLAFNPVSADGLILVTTANPPLLCFESATGREHGRFDLSGRFVSSPLLDGNRVALSVYQEDEDSGFLLLLEPEVSVTLTASLASPQPAGVEITLSAQAVGFIRPRYEFYLWTGEIRQVVQRESEKSTWTWFPLQPGEYKIGVRVRDDRKTKETEIPFIIIK